MPSPLALQNLVPFTGWHSSLIEPCVYSNTVTLINISQNSSSLLFCTLVFHLVLLLPSKLKWYAAKKIVIKNNVGAVIKCLRDKRKRWLIVINAVTPGEMFIFSLISICSMFLSVLAAPEISHYLRTEYVRFLYYSALNAAVSSF